MNMPSWRSRRPACVGIMLACPDSAEPTPTPAAIAEWADDVSPGLPSPNGEARGSSIARLCRHLTSSGWSFGGRATGHYRQGSRSHWPCGAHASGPPTPGPAPPTLGIVGLEAATRPAHLDPIWPIFPAIIPYFRGAAAEPGRLGAPVKTFIQVTKTKGLTDRGYRAVPPLVPLCVLSLE